MGTTTENDVVNEGGMTVLDLLIAVRKHVITAAITFVVVVAAVTGYTFTRTPMYTASAQLLATYKSSSAAQDTNAAGQLNSGASYIKSQIATYPELVKTEAVLQPVIADLGLNTTVSALATQVTASNPTDTMLVEISVEDADPKSASNIANSVADSLTKQITATLTSDEGEKIVSPVNLTKVQQAYVPASPSSPNKKLNIAAAVAGGLILGVIAALIKDLLDRRVRQASDVTAIVPDTPILGTFSRSDMFTDKAPTIISHPVAREAEEIRRLRTNLMFSLPETNLSNVIVVASAGQSEGKTTTSVNLATAFAETGSSVLLIDADVRNPSVSGHLGIEGNVGLTQLLTNQLSSQDAIQRYWKPNFHVLPAGKQSMSPSIMLNSRAMKSLIAQVAGHYDHVIIDTAPMHVANDAAVFAKEGGELLLVVGLGVTEKKELRTTAQELTTLEIKPAGISLNFAEAEKQKDDYYYYYGSDEKDSKGSKDSKGDKAGKDKKH